MTDLYNFCCYCCHRPCPSYRRRLRSIRTQRWRDSAGAVWRFQRQSWKYLSTNLKVHASARRLHGPPGRDFSWTLSVFYWISVTYHPISPETYRVSAQIFRVACDSSKSKILAKRLVDRQEPSRIPTCSAPWYSGQFIRPLPSPVKLSAISICVIYALTYPERQQPYPGYTTSPCTSIFWESLKNASDDRSHE